MRGGDRALDDASTLTGMAGMKWWGWGQEDVSFTHDDKPDLAPFLRWALDLDVTRSTAGCVAFDELDVPEPQLAPDLLSALEAAVRAAHVSNDALPPPVHARGKSL